MKSEREVNEDGTISWYKLGTDILHNENGPAFESDDGKEWWFNNKLHRLDGPAAEYADGHKEWWVHGKRHRIDGPAIEWTDGRGCVWYVNNVHCKDKIHFKQLLARWICD